MHQPRDAHRVGVDPARMQVRLNVARNRALSGFTVRPATESGDKLTRFGPFSSQCRAGNVKLRRGSWNEELFRVLEGFLDLAHEIAAPRPLEHVSPKTSSLDSPREGTGFEPSVPLL